MPRDNRGAVTVLVADGDRLKIPPWMLAPTAACAPVKTQATPSRLALLGLVELVELVGSSSELARNGCTASLSRKGKSPTKEGRFGAKETRSGMDSAGGSCGSSRGSSRGAGEAHGESNDRDLRKTEGGSR